MQKNKTQRFKKGYINPHLQTIVDLQKLLPLVLFGMYIVPALILYLHNGTSNWDNSLRLLRLGRLHLQFTFQGFDLQGWPIVADGYEWNDHKPYKWP